MPSVKNYKKNHKNKVASKSQDLDSEMSPESKTNKKGAAGMAQPASSEKRRPLTEKSDSTQQDAHEATSEPGSVGTHQASNSNETSSDHEAPTDPVYVKTMDAAEDSSEHGAHAESENDSTQSADQGSDHAELHSEGTQYHAESDSEKIRIEFPGSEILRAKAPKAFEVAEAVAEDWVKDGDFEGLPVGHPLAQLVASVGLKKAKKVENKLKEKGVFLMVQMGYELAKAKIDKIKNKS